MAGKWQYSDQFGLIPRHPTLGYANPGLLDELEDRAALADEALRFADEARRIVSRTYSPRGSMGVHEPPSPRLYQDWLARYDEWRR